MSDMPERIRAYCDGGAGGNGWYTYEPFRGIPAEAADYVRGDIADEMLAALKEARDLIDNAYHELALGVDPYYGSQSDIDAANIIKVIAKAEGKP